MITRYQQKADYIPARGVSDSGRSAILSLAICLIVLVTIAPIGQKASAASWSGADTARGRIPASLRDLNVGRPEGWEFEHLGQLQVAPVVVNGDILFHVIGIASFPADKRAGYLARKIEALAEDESYDPNDIYIIEKDQRHYLYRDKRAQGESMMVIHDEDAALEGIGRDVVAMTFREKIISSILSFRHDRQPDVILTQALHAIGRTLALVAILYVLLWGFRRLDVILETRLKRRIENIEAKSMRILQAEQIWNALRYVLKAIRVLLVLILMYLFLNFVLGLFPWTRYLSRMLLHLVIDPLQGIAGAVIDYIPSFIFLLLLFFIARYVLKALRSFFLAIARGSVSLTNFEAEWAIPTYRIVRVLVVVFALVLAYPYIPGSESEAFKGISILLGVLFSLGSTSMISNVVAGYTMTYRRAFRIGDRVRIGNTVGDVTDQRMLVTHIRSLKNEEVVIPNSTIMNAEITNYSSLAGEYGLILHTTVGIGYEVPWRQVEAMLLMAADRTTAGVLKEPKPFVLQTALADFAVNYELNVYCGDEKNAVALYSELHRNILDVFNEYGVQIMTPAYERDTPEPKLVPKDQWYAEPAEPPNEK